MKTLLNLLPEEKKDAIQNRLRSRFLLWQLFLVFVLEAFYLTMLVSTYLVLDYQLKSLKGLEASSPLASQEDIDRLSGYEQTFEETNALVEDVSRIDAAHLHFSQVFKILDPLLSSGITINELATVEYRVSLAGVAKDRDDLLRLDERLKSAKECVTDVNIPISNLFSQKDIDFQMDFSILPDCLKKL
jgi:hypothetical protein